MATTSELLNSANTKRKLEAEFDDDSSSSSSDSKSDSKMFKLEHNILEGEMKASLIKLINLEKELANERIERKKADEEFSREKEKLLEELKLLREQKNQLDSVIKSAKTNEKLLYGEMEHLRQAAEKYEKKLIPEKDSEIQNLKLEINNLKGETKSIRGNMEAENTQLKFDLESKKSELAMLTDEIENLKELTKSSKESQKKLEEMRKEYSIIQNSLRDAQIEITRLKESGDADIKKFIDQSSVIKDLERENRNLKTDVDYLKAVQEKSHLYQEELEGKKKQIERYEKRFIDLELEKSALQEEINSLRQTIQSHAASNSNDDLKQAIAVLKDELAKNKQKLKDLAEERQKLKLELDSREDSIGELQLRLTRAISERNGYKKIIDMGDETIKSRGSDGEVKLLRRRIEELEIILHTYKKTLKESDEIKLSGNSSFRLENIDIKCAEVQVNLNAEIYSDYEKQIHALKNELEAAKSQIKNQNEAKREQTGSDEFTDEKENIQVEEERQYESL